MLPVRALPAWQAYGLALAASLLTAALAVALSPWLGPGAWLLFAVPVALSAWVGGFGPGALATLLAVLALSVFLIQPITDFSQLSLAQVGPVASAALVLAFLSALVARASQAAQRAHALALRAESLAQAGLALAQAANPPAVLESLAQALASAVPAGLVVQSLSDDRETLHTAAVHHPAVEAQTALREAYAAPQKAADSPGSAALTEGQTVRLASITAEQLRAGLKPRFWPNLERFAGHSLLLAPIRSQGITLGLVSVLRGPAGGPFTDDELAWVTALADHAGASLHSAQRSQAEAQQRQAAETSAAAAWRLQSLAAALVGARTPEQVAAVQLDLSLAPAEPDEAARAALDKQSALVLERLNEQRATEEALATSEQGAARLAELQAATAELSQALTLAEVVDLVLQHGLALARAEAGALALRHDDQPALELVRSRGYTELALRSLRRLRLDQPAAEAQAAASGTPVWLASREDYVTAFPQFAPAYASLRCEAVWALPLSAGGAVLGTLTLALAETGHPSDPQAENLLALAALCGQAVWRAQQYDRERLAREAADRARERATYLSEVGDNLSATLNLPTTLQSLARLVLPHLADFSLAFAIGHEGAVLGAAHAHRDPEREATLGGAIRHLMTLPGDKRTLIHDMLRAGRLLHVPEISASMLASLPEDHGLRAIVTDLAPKTLLIVPLLAEDRPLGVLVLCAAEAARFGPVEQSLAQALAQRAARAIEHALRHAVAQSLNVELEERVNERTEELQATIAKLEAENSERERTQAQLEVSRGQLRSLSQRLQAAREEERARIAREVHDGLGQQLAGIKMDIAWMRKTLREQQEPLLRKAKAMADLIDTTVQSVRKITQELRPGILDDFGLLAALEWQLQEFQTRHNIDAQLLSSVDDLPLDSESATAIFRVFQETLTNVARHAHATRVEVSLEVINDYLLLQVEDNGRGITDRELFGAGSLGLLGMRERIHLLAGEIDIRGVPNEGTLVRVRVPLPRPAPDSAANAVNGATEPAPGPRAN